MKFKFNKDRTKLIITADKQERKWLHELPEEPEPGCRDTIHADSTMVDYLEHITCNSELQWISSDITGDLTTAPMLCILGDVMPLPSGLKKWDLLQGTVLAGCWADTIWVHPVLERWAFMDYGVRSVLQDLRDTGEAVFVGGAYA